MTRDVIDDARVVPIGEFAAGLGLRRVGHEQEKRQTAKDLKPGNFYQGCIFLPSIPVFITVDCSLDYPRLTSRTHLHSCFLAPSFRAFFT